MGIKTKKSFWEGRFKVFLSYYIAILEIGLEKKQKSVGIKVNRRSVYNEGVKFSLFLPVFLLCIPFLVEGFVFSRPLSLGDSGQDVMELQKVLNGNSKTQIALAGPGSPGNETSYFGLLTLRAVVAFQDLYQSEVLIPAGLSGGTGIVGPLTRQKLNTITPVSAVVSEPLQSAISLVPQTPASSPVPPDRFTLFLRSIFQNDPKILSLSQYEAERGQSITIVGSNFTPTNNTIHFSGTEQILSGILSPDEQTLKFTVPDWVPLGGHNLFVSNVNGTSFEESFGEYFQVVKNARGLPRVTEVSPNPLRLSEEEVIIIKGENFDRENNSVFSSLGMVSGVPSSDGRTLELSLQSFPGFSQLELFMEQGSTERSIELFLQVQTTVGFSLEPVPLSLLTS
jgi:hypothetical protein